MMPPQHKAPKVFYSNGVEGLHAVSRRVLELTNEPSVPGSSFQTREDNIVQNHVGAVDSREKRVGCEFRFFGKFYKAEVYEHK
jgi:hypothetical protein